MSFFKKLIDKIFFGKSINSLEDLKAKYPKNADHIIDRLIDTNVAKKISNFFSTTTLSNEKLSSLSWRDFKLFYPLKEFNADLQKALKIETKLRLPEEDVTKIFHENRSKINSLINSIYLKSLKRDKTFTNIEELALLPDKPGDVAEAKGFKVNSSVRNYAIAYIGDKLFVGKPGEHHADLAKQYLAERNLSLLNRHGNVIDDPDQFDIKNAVQNKDGVIDATTEEEIDPNISYMFGHVWNLIGFIDDISPDLSFDSMANLIKSQLNLDKVYRHSYDSSFYPRLAKKQ